ncbi:hypothetical protein PR048_013086 [Dryococelus australis]|uniref:Uncharacterized protein n=1 Tax=Dryococelus australis TaxID=614101 RepID=A0ABQ9HR74_9NEOP|nr:hypothetical protein PR048_013086 [Dryococelus australis]
MAKLMLVLLTKKLFFHRLKLSVKWHKQLTYLANVFKILGEVHEFYSKSPTHIHQFQELAMILGEKNVTSVPTSRVQGVRCVSHKNKCLDVLVRNYNVIVSQLKNWVTGNNSQAAKLSGIIKTMKSSKFVALVLFFKDILNYLSNLSSTLQYDDIDILYASTILKHLYSSLASMTDGYFGNAPTGISLSHCYSVDTFKESYNDVLTQLHDLVHKRFSDLYENDLIKFGTEILHGKMWPTDEKNQ